MKHKGKKGQKADKPTQKRYNADKHHMRNGARKILRSFIPKPGKLKAQLDSGQITQEQYDEKLRKANVAVEAWKRTVGLRVKHQH